MNATAATLLQIFTEEADYIATLAGRARELAALTLGIMVNRMYLKGHLCVDAYTALAGRLQALQEASRGDAETQSQERSGIAAEMVASWQRGEAERRPAVPALIDDPSTVKTFTPEATA